MTTNYIAIILVTIITVVLGMGWFGPLFGSTWAKINGLKNPSEMTPAENKLFQKKMLPVYIVNIVITFVMMYVLYFYVKGWSVVSGITAAFSAWFGFVMPIEAANALWSGKPKRDAWTMFLVTAGYQLLCFIIAGAMYAGMK